MLPYHKNYVYHKVENELVLALRHAMYFGTQRAVISVTASRSVAATHGELGHGRLSSK